jgi:SagB-type dehydrogenase family enzyme
MRIKVADCAAMFWDEGRLVWDDYVNHQQFALTPESERVVAWFRTWRDLDTVHGLGTDAGPIAERLLEAGVLVAEDSPRREAEKAVLAEWGAWGPAARYYHFASRTPSGAGFLDADADAARREGKLAFAEAPAVVKTYPDAERVELPGAADDHGWTEPSLLGALTARRSCRAFAADSITGQELGTLLALGAGVTATRGDAGAAPDVFRTSPSAGARSPLEVYVIAIRVEGLEAGVYHYDALDHRLERLADLPADDVLTAALGGQTWAAAAPALLVHTAVPARSRFRYDTGRAYRDLLLTLGHLSQNVLLLATALGLGSLFVTAVRDEDLEAILGLDHTTEPVLGVTALGRRA